MTLEQLPQDERREQPRLLIEDYFSLCISLPNEKKPHATRIKDLSLSGIRFFLYDNSTLQKESIIAARLYVNNTLYLPLELKILRTGKSGYGCQFVNTDAGTIEALKHFIAFLQIASSTIESES